MTTCADDTVERVEPVIPGSDRGASADLGEVYVMTAAIRGVERTARRDTDENQALIRGLAQYMRSLRFSHTGRPMAFAMVTENWAQLPDAGEEAFPLASVHTEEDGTYDTSVGSKAPTKADQVGTATSGDGIFVTARASYTVQIMIEIVCTDDEERAGVRMMVLDGLMPDPNRRDLILVLPHYHNALARFDILSAKNGDDPETAKIGLRPLSVRVAANVDVFRTYELPLAKPRAQGSITT